MLLKQLIHLRLSYRLAFLSIRSSIFLVILISFLTGYSVTLTRADDYGCQVLLCLTNPGGPTQYGECVPPIERLWSDLRHFRGFPTCSGVGYSASSPVYDPYYCEPPAQLVSSPTHYHGSSGQNNDGDRVSYGEEVQCQTKLAEPLCKYLDHEQTCEWFTYRPPFVREKPHRIDLTIEGRGVQRIWY